MKKRGFGEGKRNGFGRNVEEDETAKETMKRELLKETAVTALELEEMGI